MTNYLEICIPYQTPEQKDVLIAQLTDIGFEGYDETSEVLKAYIPEGSFNEALLKSTLRLYNLSYDISAVAPENWNQLWESSFEPVVVDDFCAIRAIFHAIVPDVRHDIIITPKMSFGTGHHPTTYLMIMAMQKIMWTEKTVVDFGTGTGILAILAEKSGAAEITAIDNDDWSISNAMENLMVNQCKKITLYKADSLPYGQHFDVILANLNKNIILGGLPSITEHLPVHGTIVLSGLLVDDVNEIMETAASCKLKQTGLQQRNNWVCIQLIHEAHICDGFVVSFT
ncbi:MAG: 50S ribosomal protein L11 methyltransferase [Chitinophagaceae bacterium]